jgi:hypothetical protein
VTGEVSRRLGEREVGCWWFGIVGGVEKLVELKRKMEKDNQNCMLFR